MSLTITLQRTAYTANDSINAEAFNNQSALSAAIADGGSYLFGLGSLGAPSVGFIGDADTGLYSPGADRLALVTAGVDRVVIGATGALRLPAYGAGVLAADASGNLASRTLTGADIATTSTPQLARLGIGAAADVTIPLLATVAGGSTGTYLARFLGADSWHNGVRLGNSTSRDWALLVNGSARSPAGGFSIFDNTAVADRLVIDSNGKVGIGVATPSGVFDVGKIGGGRVQIVNEGANIYNVLHSRNADDSAYLPLTTRTLALTIEAPSAGVIGTIKSPGETRLFVGDSANSITAQLGAAINGAYVGTYSAHAFALRTGDLSRVTVSAAGTVQFNNYGTGVLKTDASGNITASTAISASLTGNVTGTLTAPLGAVGTPSLTFSGDTNTGIYSPGADQLSLVTAGAARLTVSASGGLLVPGTVTVNSGGSPAGTVRNITISTDAPSGGADGDVWLQYTA